MAQLKNILLVDDDYDLREALAEQLILLDEFEVASTFRRYDCRAPTHAKQ